jgi:urease accessory protein UreE
VGAYYFPRSRLACNHAHQLGCKHLDFVISDSESFIQGDSTISQRYKDRKENNNGQSNPPKPN